ncbi:hypothetical protein ACQP2C_29720 [Micromonospora zamorensis]|uniref:hypothetical protein n=1 Tax=Micromonospora zamorensis TaxID=709883 RepID=UPI003D958A05
MKPPTCFACGSRESTENAELVYFALSPAEEAAADRRSASGWVGHPDNAVWFCLEHVQLGRDRVSLHWRDAMAEISALTRGL